MAILPTLTPDTLEFVLLSFEGPDEYSMAGGLGVRMKELALELARQGYRTHLVFVGDPRLPAQESPVDNLTLHRWSQWLSAHYPAGVYHGEEAKLVDWNEQLPGFVASGLVAPAATEGRLTAILAEEWHTAYATCQVSDRLWLEGLRDKAIVLWNANNVMGFERINWGRLDYCSQITTVSRYMKHVMWDRGVNPLVIPNGIPGGRIRHADPELIRSLRQALPGRELVFKIGRFSPDKRWNMAVDAVAQQKRRGRDVAMVIRGGIEPHGLEIIANARAQGLTVLDVKLPREVGQAVNALAETPRADIYNQTSFMSEEVVALLYEGSDAVLANSGHEPFGLVGLEVMAAGGIAFVGSTGEDYAVPYLNSVVLDTDDPSEITIALEFLRTHPEVAARMRADAQETARSFSWENVITDSLVGKLEYVALRQVVSPATAEPGELQPEAETTAETKTGAEAERGEQGCDPLPYGGRSVGRSLPVKPRSASRTTRAAPHLEVSAEPGENAVEDPSAPKDPPSAGSKPTKMKRKPAR